MALILLILATTTILAVSVHETITVNNYWPLAGDVAGADPPAGADAAISPAPSVETGGNTFKVSEGDAERFRIDTAKPPDAETVKQDAVDRVMAHYGETGKAHFIPEDINGDGIVDLFDLIALGQTQY